MQRNTARNKPRRPKSQEKDNSRFLRELVCRASRQESLEQISECIYSRKVPVFKWNQRSSVYIIWIHKSGLETNWNLRGGYRSPNKANKEEWSEPKSLWQDGISVLSRYPLAGRPPAQQRWVRPVLYNGKKIKPAWDADFRARIKFPWEGCHPFLANSLRRFRLQR